MTYNANGPDDRNHDQEVVVRDQWQQVMTPTGPVTQQVAVTEMHDEVAARRARARWISGLVSFLFGILVVLIALRFLLKAIIANPDNGFVQFIYSVTEPFVAPFLTILPATSNREGQVWEWSSLIAIAIYLMLDWMPVKLIHLLIVRPASGSTATRVERSGK